MKANDYITRHAALRALQLNFGDYGGARRALCEIPAADVAQVVRGRWELLRKGDWTSVFVCSVCGLRETIAESESYNSQLKMPRKYPYCHCGAKMYIEDGGDSDAAD